MSRSSSSRFEVSSGVVTGAAVFVRLDSRFARDAEGTATSASADLLRERLRFFDFFSLHSG